MNYFTIIKINTPFLWRNNRRTLLNYASQEQTQKKKDFHSVAAILSAILYKYVLRDFIKVFTEIESLIFSGILFQIEGAADENVLQPIVFVLVLTLF